VKRFCEKPDRETAERFLTSGDYLWNGGIFLFRGETLLRHLRTHLPALHQGLEAMAAAPDRLDELYGRLPAVSIDVGLMEKLDDIATLPLDCGWSDLGSWQALAEQLPAADDGNVRHGEVLAFDAQDNLLWAEQGTIAVVGVQGLVVVRTGDSVLVIPKNRSQEVRRLVDEWKAQGRTELL
jgi:mannose-1-phosphate guanylyltransferase